jgi:hypothetical protein
MKTTEKRNLDVELTDLEVAAYADSLAIDKINLDNMKEEKARSNKAYTESIKELDEALTEVAIKVRSKKEEREVECRWDYDFTLNTKTLIRTDTGEVVETRVIEASERQEQLIPEA